MRTLPDSARLLRILTSLPFSNSVFDLVTATREKLGTILPGVDHISLIVNVECNLLNPNGYKPDIGAMGHQEQGELDLSVGHITSDHEQRLLDRFRQSGFPFENYHPPTTRIYRLQRRAYLGGIVLWRYRENRPLKQTTIRRLDAIEDFMILLMTELVLRAHYLRPADSEYRQHVKKAIATLGLTPQEGKVLFLIAHGHTPEQMVEVLSRSINTIKTHIKSVYQKADVHSSGELIARYLLPRLE